MRDYADVVNNLRCCTVSVPCDNCTYQNDTEKCTFLEKEAADAIEELLAAVPHWISVEDELPEDYKYVLCVDEGNVIMGFYVDECGWGDMDTFRIYPTHWMPLPEPPKEDDDANT